MGHRFRLLTRGHAPQLERTPLHAAVMEDQLEVVRVLLGAGADISARDMVSDRRVGGEGQIIREIIYFGKL